MKDNMKRYLWGLVFIGLAVLLILDAFEILHFNLFFRGWWTFFIMIPCFIGIITDEHKKGSIIGFAIGLALFLSYQDIIKERVLGKLLIPVILLIIGVSIIWPSKSKKKIINIKINNKNYAESDLEFNTFFSNRKVNFDNQEFKGAEVEVAFGSVIIDLEEAIINQDAILDCDVAFGSVTIKVPQNINVVVESEVVCGKLNDKRPQRLETTNYEKTLYIDGDCAFGSINLL